MEDPECEQAIVGYQSGKRSAVLAVVNEGETTKYLRLKGCGNVTQGFNMQNMEYPPEYMEVRGVQFVNTAFRELYFSAKVHSILQPFGLMAGNKPHGLWKYSHTIKNTENAFPLIEKYCGIYETFGDKRLATNLITGLFGIIDRLLLSAIKSGAIDEEELLMRIIAAYPERRLKDGKLKETYRCEMRQDPWMFEPKQSVLEWI